MTNFLLTLPAGPRAGLRVKCATFALVLLVFTLVEFPFYMGTLVRQSVSGGLLVKVGLYDVAGRLLGIATFLAVVMVITQLVAALGNAVIALICALVAYVALSVAQGCMVVVPLVRGHTGFDFAIGVDGAFAGASQFVNILPVMVWGRGATPSAVAQTTVQPMSLLINAALLVASVLIWRLVVPRIRVNYIK